MKSKVQHNKLEVGNLRPAVSRSAAAVATSVIAVEYSFSLLLLHKPLSLIDIAMYMA